MAQPSEETVMQMKRINFRKLYVPTTDICTTMRIKIAIMLVSLVYLS